MPRLVLASSSPRRRELLAGAGLRFEVLAAAVDEDALPPGTPPAAVARLLARAKARAVAALLAPESAVVLGADTVVALDDGRLLGKPSDRGQAEGHLRALSGTTHSVFTGVCLLGLPSGVEEVFHVETRVTMRPLSDAEVRDYAARGTGLDRAGGYSLQEGGDAWVTRLEGSRTNVVGLPIDEVLERLRLLGVEP